MLTLSPEAEPVSSHRLTQKDRFKPIQSFAYRSIFIPHEVSGGEDLDPELEARLETLKDSIESEIGTALVVNGSSYQTIDEVTAIEQTEDRHEHSLIMRYVYLGELHPAIISAIESQNIESVLAALQEYLPQLDTDQGEIRETIF